MSWLTAQAALRVRDAWEPCWFRDYRGTGEVCFARTSSVCRYFLLGSKSARSTHRVSCARSALLVLSRFIMAKEHVSFRIDGDVSARLRAAVRHLRGAPLFLTLDAFVEETIASAVRALESKHNGGKRFDSKKRST